ncbi:MAG: zinc ribbon domain-containing protein [Acidobacteria bacterium]|nr:zinc ribbon domain-containing protein [Acidobacteriota bacterium]
MPIYEYRCRGCGNQFEILILPWSKDASECPCCHSQSLEQLFSQFAVSSKDRSKAALKAARKEYERTELRDKKIAEREEIEHHHH